MADEVLRVGDFVRLGDSKGQITNVSADGNMTRVKWASGVEELVAADELSLQTSREDFYEMAMQPLFPDEMAFELVRDESDPFTFSIEGIDEVVQQMRQFTLARLVAYGDRTGKMAKRMRAHLTVQYDDGTETVESLHDGAFPFYTADDLGEALKTVDGLRRLPLDKSFTKD